MFSNWSEGVGCGAARAFLWLVVGLASCGEAREPAVAPRASAASSKPTSPAPVVVESEPSNAAPPKSEPPASAKVVQSAPAATPPKPAAPKAPAMELGELLLKRDLWPPKVALTKPLTIERGVTLPIGHELSVYEFNGSDIALDNGSDIFECPASNTDVLERAAATKAKLTAEQLALDDNTLVQHPELWPTRVTVTRRLQFQTGKQIPVGREVALRTVTIGWVNLYDRELADHFPAEIFETDVIARARERLLLPAEQRDSFFIRSLAAALEPNATTNDPSLAKTDYVLVYRVREGCPRCEAFEPELAKFYERVKPAHANFETVLMSDDRTPEQARALFAKQKLPGRAVALERKLEAGDLATAQQGELLPLVYLYDKSGKLLTQNHPNGGSPSAAQVLDVLEGKLKDGR